jgi:SAM-dependent methyltransferase
MSLRFLLPKLAIRTLGRLSDGIDLSFREGFTSGKMLDYIYANQPSGRFLIGRYFDRIFLDNIGWRAIRMRKEHVKLLIKKSIAMNWADKKKTIILDIASGPGKYLFEVIAEAGEKDMTVILNDIDKRWLSDAQKYAKINHVSCFRFISGDSLNKEFLLSVKPRPNVVVSSGFYDWIDDDNSVRKSICDIYSALPKGGSIILTCQTGHRDLQFVNEVFIGFNKKPLNMIVRKADAIGSWLAKAGFRDIESVSDDWGLYTVMRGCK